MFASLVSLGLKLACQLPPSLSAASERRIGSPVNLQRNRIEGLGKHGVSTVEQHDSPARRIDGWRLGREQTRSILRVDRAHIHRAVGGLTWRARGRDSGRRRARNMGARCSLSWSDESSVVNLRRLASGGLNLVQHTAAREHDHAARAPGAAADRKWRVADRLGGAPDTSLVFSFPSSKNPNDLLSGAQKNAQAM